MQPQELQQELAIIQKKLKHLLDRHSALKKENGKLKTEQERLNAVISEKDEQLKTLQRQTDVIKSGIQKWNPEHKKLFVKRIDSYLKEIEKCIALINE